MKKKTTNFKFHLSVIVNLVIFLKNLFSFSHRVLNLIWCWLVRHLNYLLVVLRGAVYIWWVGELLFSLCEVIMDSLGVSVTVQTYINITKVFSLMLWNCNKLNIFYVNDYIIDGHIDRAMSIHINMTLFQKHHRFLECTIKSFQTKTCSTNNNKSSNTTCAIKIVKANKYRKTDRWKYIPTCHRIILWININKSVMNIEF